jgi:LacI family transcriptional regulator
MKKKVFIALRMAGIAGQSKLAGIFRYLAERYGETHPWNIELVRSRLEVTQENITSAIESGVDGFIASIPGIENALNSLANSEIPAVLADMSTSSFECRKKNLAVIHNSAMEIGREAAFYFMRQGIARAYAFIHAQGKPEWSQKRFSAFRDILADNGHWCAELNTPEDVSRLKKGTAIMAANDDTAFKLVEVIKAKKLKIPADFTILGVDNDTLICENARPRLSSIQPDFESEGFIAAKILDEMMQSNTPTPVRTILAGVKRIVRRESTAEISHAGQLVQKAIAYIDRHATDGIDVSDVVAHLGCSRRLADLRFRQLQGRSILEAIIERRLTIVRQRLAETRDTIETITSDCGFSNPNYLKNLFKKRYSMTMSEFRRAGSLLRNNSN